MAGSLTVGGLATGLPTGQKQIGPLTMQGSALIGTTLDVTLATGDNTLAVPANAAAVVLAVPSNNTATLKVRTNADSGGLSLGLSGFLVVPLPAGATSVIVNASAGGTQVEATFI
jgi:hypothetical protein